MSTDDPETEARLRDFVDGDDRALQWLLERHRPRLKRMIALRLDVRLASRLDPSDIVQEVLINAARKLPDYARDRPVPFYPWLHRMASERLAQTHRRHLRARRRDAGREQAGDAPWGSGVAALADLLADSGTSPSGGLIRDEERRELALALEQLPGPDREILMMRYLDQLNFAEIAAVLAITEATARVRHFRALQRLGPLLGPSAEGSRS
jgi:RNA polymerase sigma-70 factor (ECF subfamily)